MLDLFTFLIFLMVLIGFYAVRSLSRRRQKQEAIEARLAQLRQDMALEMSAPEAVLQGTQSVVRPRDTAWFAAWPWLSGHANMLRAHLETLGWLANLRQRLWFSAAAAFVAALLLARMTGTAYALVLATAPILWLLLCVLAYQKAWGQHLKALGAALPEAIDAITRVCRAGVPIHGAFGIAADHLQGPLTGELRQIENWLKLGVPLKQAMQSSAERVPLAQYRFFAVILIISQESGGRLGDTLERLSQTLRARAELQLKVQAKTSEARASAKIVALLVPGVLLYMFFNAPADFHFLFNDKAGIKVMLYAAASVGLGLLITHLMVRRVR